MGGNRLWEGYMYDSRPEKVDMVIPIRASGITQNT